MKQQKISKKEQRKQEVTRKKRRRTLLIVTPITIVVLLLAGLLLYRLLEPEVTGLLTFGTQARTHDREAEFTNTGLPPTGGSHNPTWLNCGIYDTPVDSSLAVHSLEHGAVWLAYHPELPQDQVESLRELVRGEAKVVMSPFPELDGDVVLSAWSKQVVIADVTDERVAEFINRYQGQGPEPGASCRDGVGTPIE